MKTLTIDTEYFARISFWDKVAIDPNPYECWLWEGTTKPNGYPLVWDGASQKYAHRVAYTLSNGPITPGMAVDHMCRTPLCVNPKHLQVTTREANTDFNASKTHCPEGHPYDGDNTYSKPTGGRLCRSCRRTKSRAYKARKRAAK